MSEPAAPPPQWDTPPPTQPPAAPGRNRSNDLAALVLGLIILGVGVYFLARETFQIALPDIGELWPIIVIILGVAIIYGGLRRRNA
jgi:hypothetical protein